MGPLPVKPLDRERCLTVPQLSLLSFGTDRASAHTLVCKLDVRYGGLAIRGCLWRPGALGTPLGSDSTVFVVVKTTIEILTTKIVTL